MAKEYWVALRYSSGTSWAATTVRVVAETESSAIAQARSKYSGCEIRDVKIVRSR